MANEKRLIDANELVRKANELEIFYFTGETDIAVHDCQMVELGAVLAEIDEAPTVDAVEVVRCKDCKKGHPELAPNGGVWCALWNHVFRDNGFCSKGERRTDG